MDQTSEKVETSHSGNMRADLWWFVTRMALAAGAAVAAYVLMTSDSFGGVTSHALGDSQDLIATLTGGKVTCLCAVR